MTEYVPPVQTTTVINEDNEESQGIDEEKGQIVTVIDTSNKNKEESKGSQN